MLPWSCTGTSHVHSLNDFAYIFSKLSSEKMSGICSASHHFKFFFSVYFVFTSCFVHKIYTNVLVVKVYLILLIFGLFCYHVLFCCIVFCFCLVVVSFLTDLFC